MKIQWKRADGFTKDCFNKWGYNYWQAVLMATNRDKNGVVYDATILKHNNGSFIPCQGSVRLKAVKTMREAKSLLNNWLIKNCN